MGVVRARSWPVLLVLAACSRGVDWHGIEVVDETTNGEAEWLVELALREVHWMADVTGLPSVGVETIAFVDSIDVPDGEIENADPEATGYVAGGAYHRWKRRIEVSMQHPTPSSAVRHELCHAIDRSTKLSKEHRDLLTLEFMPEALRRSTEFLPEHEAAEVLAVLCEQWAPDRYMAAVAKECEVALQDEATALVQSWTFPELVPPMGDPVALGVDTWVDVPLEDGQSVHGSTLVSGVLWTMVHTVDGTDEQVLAIDPATGAVLERRHIPGAADGAYRRMVVSDDLLVVYVQGRTDGVSWVDGQWRPVTLPDPPWLPGDPHAGKVFFQRWDPAAVLVWDPTDSSWTEETLPEGARPDSFDLLDQGERLLLNSRPFFWEREGEGWVPFDGPHAYGADQWALLRDDRTVSAWRVGSTGGLSISSPDGTYSVAAGACEGASGVVVGLRSDGQQVVAWDRGRIGVVRLP